MIIAAVSITGIRDSPSVSKYVQKAIDVFKKRALKYQVGPMFTTIEAPTLREIFDAIEEAHEAVKKAGALRIVTNIKIDERVDKEITMETKLENLKL